MPYWIEVFKVGEHTDSSGHTDPWSATDLDTIVSTYNNQSPADHHDAPIVLGHPDTDSPAYGWVLKLQRVGESLYALVDNVSEWLMQAVRDKKYRKRSIALDADGMLRHIGFLGGAAPAVKGLADIEWSDYNPVAKEYESEFTSEFRAEETPEEKAHRQRSEKFHIQPRSGRSARPEEYSGIRETEFADRVNYMYPTSKDHIRGSLLAWSQKPEARSQYTEEEQNLISRELLLAARFHRINIDPKQWSFATLLNPSAAEPKLFIQESPMDDQLLGLLIPWVAEQFGEEIAGQLTIKIIQLRSEIAKAEAAGTSVPDGAATAQDPMAALVAGGSNMSELFEEYPEDIREILNRYSKAYTAPIKRQWAKKPAAKPAIPAEFAAQFAEMENQRKADQARIAQLESRNRAVEFADKIAGLGDKVSPAQREIGLQLMEILHDAGVRTFAFSDGTVKTPAVDMFVKFAELQPDRDLTSEFANDETAGEGNRSDGGREFAGMTVDADRMKVYNRTIELMKTDGVDLNDNALFAQYTKKVLREGL